ncbi:Na+/H+ antiporter subunit E [Gleimia sp. 6138-11-ORH1]|uniref:Na+/H+ antiporter subunit E n=1 Tax=Gleimia sp. 6138-11-ORH1 TaxID=2973937 RepID=UPI002169B5E6|nr:Na+/H+ antiporter subunit E [Gleimia sp. 6138-11-ORH1]MCS4484704.1 Na+/H+ antiporter subunit E [Gleimia sp. 6138-11-ORH1]
MTSPRLVSYTQRISPFITLCLWALWLLLFASVDLLIVLSGLFVALLVQVAFPLPHSGLFNRIRVLPTLWLISYFLGEVVLAAWVISVQVMRVVLVKLRVLAPQQAKIESAVIVVPLTSSEDIILSMTAAMINLIPGTIVLEMEVTPPALTLHVFDLRQQGGESAVIASVQAQEKRILRCVSKGRQA